MIGELRPVNNVMVDEEGTRLMAADERPMLMPDGSIVSPAGPPTVELPLLHNPAWRQRNEWDEAGEAAPEVMADDEPKDIAIPAPPDDDEPERVPVPPTHDELYDDQVAAEDKPAGAAIIVRPAGVTTATMEMPIDGEGDAADERFEELREMARNAPDHEKNVWALMIGSVAAAHEVERPKGRMSIYRPPFWKATARQAVLHNRVVALEWALDSSRAVEDVALEGIAAQYMTSDPAVDFGDTLTIQEEDEPARWGLEQAAPREMKPYLSFIRASLAAARRCKSELLLPRDRIVTAEHRHVALTVNSYDYWKLQTKRQLYREQARAVAYGLDQVMGVALDDLKAERQSGNRGSADLPLLTLLYQDMDYLEKQTAQAGKPVAGLPREIASLRAPSMHKTLRRNGTLRAQSKDFLSADARQLLRSASRESSEI